MKTSAAIDRFVASWAYYVCLSIGTSLFLLLFSFSASPLYLHWGGDNTVFEQLGNAILQGKIPYIDIFDHKGLLLYLFNAFGLFISHSWGIYLLQCIFLSATVIVWDITMRHLGVDKMRPVLIFGFLLILMGLFNGGNYTEDWSLLFISLPLLFHVISLQRQQPVTLWQYFVVGACFGAITFIRLNNAIPFVMFFVWQGIVDLTARRWKLVLKELGMAICGFLIIALPCTFYFYIKAGTYGVDAMLYGMFGFNFDYMQTGSMKDREDDVLFFSTYATIIIGSILTYRKKINILIPLLLVFVTCAFTMRLRHYGHYLIILLPCVVMIAGNLAGAHHKLWSILLVVAIAIPWHSNIFKSVMRTRRELLYGKIWYKDDYAAFHDFAQILDSKERNSIYNYNGDMEVLALLNAENLVQCNRVILGSQKDCSPRLRNECQTDNLQHSKPQIVLVCDKPTPEDARFLDSLYSPILESHAMYTDLTIFRLKK